MGILQLISSRNFITVNKDLIKTFGLEEAIILGELASEYDYWEKQNNLDEEGYFYSTIENVENNTTIKEKRQRKAINNLKNFGVIDVKLKGIPPKRFIKINENKLFEVCLNSNGQYDFYKSANLTDLKPPKEPTNNNILNNNITNNNINNKERKKEKKQSFDELIESYTLNLELREELKNHLATRKSKKATLTNRAIELSLKKLDDLVKNIPINEQEEMKIKIVQQSIERGWTAFYELPIQKNKKGDGWKYLDEEINKMPF